MLFFLKGYFPNLVQFSKKKNNVCCLKRINMTVFTYTVCIYIHCILLFFSEMLRVFTRES